MKDLFRWGIPQQGAQPLQMQNIQQQQQQYFYELWTNGNKVENILGSKMKNENNKRKNCKFPKRQKWVGSEWAQTKEISRDFNVE